jgi:hypothetical protein
MYLLGFDLLESTAGRGQSYGSVKNKAYHVGT